MSISNHSGSFICLILIGVLIACTTDPLPPNGGFNQGPPIQDPGLDSSCADGQISFQHQILPIMVSACAYSGCHDAKTAEEGVVLDNYEAVSDEVTPGSPNNSELYESITESGDDIMPPPPAALLSRVQIQLIKDWILQGAQNTNCGAPCDSSAVVTFSGIIYPLLKDYCIGCHSSARSDGNVNIENYDKLMPYVENGVLMGTIRADAFYPVMPPSGSLLSNCRIQQLERWIQEGAKNN